MKTTSCHQYNDRKTVRDWNFPQAVTVFTGVKVSVLVLVRVFVSVLVFVTVAVLAGVTVLVMVSPPTDTLVLEDVPPMVTFAEGNRVLVAVEVVSSLEPRSRPPNARSRNNPARIEAPSPKLDVKSLVPNWRFEEGMVARGCFHRFTLHVFNHD